MPTTHKDFKKIMIDLDLTLRTTGAGVGISGQAVNMYFMGRSRSPERRAQIRAFLEARAEQMGIVLPEIWPETGEAA